MLMLSSILLMCLSQSTHQISHIQPQGYFDGEMEFADADGDGDLDLFVAVFVDYKRYIDVYLQHENLFATTPQQHIQIPDTVVAWAVGDFLPDQPGEEIIWTAARGVYVRNSAGRPQVLSRSSQLLDVPYAFSAPRLNTVADIDNDGLPEIVLLTTTGYQVMQHDGTVSGTIDLQVSEGRAPVAASNLFGGKIRPKLSSQELSSLFVPNEDVGVINYPAALFSSVSLPTPVWADVNGDGLQDLTYKKENMLYVHLQNSEFEFLPQADRIFALPDSSKSKYEQLEWVTVGGKKTADLLMVRSSEDVLSQTRPWQVRLYLDPWQAKSLDVPDALFKIQSTALGVHLFDVNGDDALDVCTSNWSLDLGLLGRGSPQLDHIASAYLADESGWGVRPVFAEKRSMSVDDIDSFVTLDSFTSDLTGDGAPDFVELSENGSLRVRKFEVSEGGVSIANSNTIDLPLQALAAKVGVIQLNSDSTGDIVITRSQAIEIFMSTIK
jgi:hypothetical protein